MGMTGPIGCGKTTFAEFLAGQSKHHGHWESWQIIAEVANGLRQQPLQQHTANDYSALNTWLEPLPALVASVTNQTMDTSLATVTVQKITAEPDLYVKLLEYASLVTIDAYLLTGGITIETNNAFAAMAMVEASVGIAVLDPLPALGVLRTDVVIRPFRPSVPITVAAIFSRHRPLSKIELQFIEKVRSTLHGMAEELRRQHVFAEGR